MVGQRLGETVPGSRLWHACAVKAKRWTASVVVVGIVGGAVACGLPDTSERGFGSRQVMHVRDPLLGLRSFSYDSSAIYLARTVPDISASSSVNAPYDRTLLNLSTGVERPIAFGVLSAQLLPGKLGVGRSLVMPHFTADASIPSLLTLSAVPPLTLTFLDEVTGVGFDITNVSVQYLPLLGVDLGATLSDAILVGRPSADGTDTVPWAGQADAVAPMPAGINQIVGRDHGGFVGLTPSTNNTQSFTRFPFDGGAPIEIAPGVLDTRTTVTGDDASMSETTAASLPSSNVVPAIFCPAVSAANPAPACLMFYNRTFMDGSNAGFVRFLDDDAREVQLPGAMSGQLADQLSLSPSGGDAFWFVPNSNMPTRIYTWHVGDNHAVSCAISDVGGKYDFSGTAWRPGTGQFANIAQAAQTADMPGAWTLVEGTAGTGCQVVASGPNLINQVLYSPGGGQLALLENDPAGASKVYLAASDGSAPTVALAGDYFFDIEYHDDQRLLLWHSNTDGYSLSWLDVSTSPVIEHPIADRVRWDVRSSWTWLTPTWVLLADADLQQDGSYSLNVVNIDTGEERLVSRGVVDFRTSWSTPPDGATELVVAYVARSVSTSSQDGIWVAHLPLAGFQP
jgi:hypothetical protein